MAFPTDSFDAAGNDDVQEQGIQGIERSARVSTRKRTLESLGQRTPSLRCKRIREEQVSSVGVTLVDETRAFSPESEDSEGSEADVVQKRNEKGCRCGRTKCLKQYCACFRNDIRCSSDCVCRDCNNDGYHEEQRMKAVRMTRLNDPSAFKGTSLEIENREVLTPRGTVKTVRGCRCRRSKCQKKYCECFGAGLQCGSNCVCEDCLNFEQEPPSKPTGGKSVVVFQHGPQGVASKAQHKPLRSESQQNATRSASLASRRPLISVQVPDSSLSRPSKSSVDFTAMATVPAPITAPVQDGQYEETMHEEDTPEDWDGDADNDADLSCEALLSRQASSAFGCPDSNMEWGTKPLPLQARNGWNGDEDVVGPGGVDANDWGQTGMLSTPKVQECSFVFSPGPMESLSRNVSGIASDMGAGERLCFSRNASGIEGLSRFDSLDWTTSFCAKEEERCDEVSSLQLARQLSENIGSMLS
mmetsp:Transcript_6772/g.13370  ORF Transcript_6772/g.13370 Transcript_6772/m.13370 type:complete len:472 (-) Transcript_6772:287-1702(-)|eukprot:CAMPEP_0181311838 /NCGR_PEP_ID=MMETSP1101-20121128/13367_1 /TAXON_ID=46948 /ORGANISM="Rhodomonas abbreviata, Strain Caron Lab Isolate" /LENGTH=471 /DNA_ID=CAMNT_0023418629 /DNA_START=293 /DNA_END=1708 /DNA_ORIENTATION=-